MFLDSEAVARVVAATKLDTPAIDRLKLAPNQKELGDDLVRSFEIWGGATDGASPSVIKQKNRQLEQILKSLQKLKKQLADEQVYPIISEKLNVGDGNLRDAISRSTDVVTALIENRKPLLQQRRRDQFRKRSKLDYFVGHGLAKIFEKHFKRPAGRSHTSSGDDNGPFIRFAHQTLIELGQRRGDATIAKALQLARRNKSRRK